MSMNERGGLPENRDGAESTPVLRFDDVATSGGQPGLSFAVPPRSFQVLTGPAACGKTAILRLACLADRPARGRIWLFGRDSTTLGRNDVARVRRRIGLVFADDRLLEHLSVFDNAALAPRIVGQKRRDYAPRVAELLAWVDLGTKMDVAPSDLSCGERRRLCIARALANGPDILLADEPTGGLKRESGLRVLSLLAQIHGGGTAVLMTTRDEELAEASGAPVLRLRECGAFVDQAREAWAS